MELVATAVALFQVACDIGKCRLGRKMGKRVTFGSCFLAMATCAALLLTWSIWWVSVVGTSVPARRPFFRRVNNIPTLIQETAKITAEDIFVYALHGGWPAVNSAVRISASFLAIAASLSFAFIAAFTTERLTRFVFSVVLLAVAALSFAAFILDTVSVVKVARECSENKCVTAVPATVLRSDNICKCAPDAWFYLTLIVDVLLFVSAAGCLVLTFKGAWKSRGDSDSADVASEQAEVRQ